MLQKLGGGWWRNCLQHALSMPKYKRVGLSSPEACRVDLLVYKEVFSSGLVSRSSSHRGQEERHAFPAMRPISWRHEKLVLCRWCAAKHPLGAFAQEVWRQGTLRQPRVLSALMLLGHAIVHCKSCRQRHVQCVKPSDG